MPLGPNMLLSLFSTAVTSLALMTYPVSADVAEGSFEPFDCYFDLCVRRDQFCSKTEERCKNCEAAHCFDTRLTPKECRPLCPELLRTTAVPTTVLTTTTLGLSTKQDGSKTDVISTPRPTASSGATLDQQIGPLGSTILPPLVIGIAVAVIILLVLVVVILCYIRRARRTSKTTLSLPLNHPLHDSARGRLRNSIEFQRGTAVLVEEGRTLLPEAIDSGIEASDNSGGSSNNSSRHGSRRGNGASNGARSSSSSSSGSPGNGESTARGNLPLGDARQHRLLTSFGKPQRPGHPYIPENGPHSASFPMESLNQHQETTTDGGPSSRSATDFGSRHGDLQSDSYPVPSIHLSHGSSRESQEIWCHQDPQLGLYGGEQAFDPQETSLKTSI